MTVNGNVTIHNYVEAGAKVENNYYGTVNQGAADSKALSLKEKLERIVPMIKNGRLWFSVCKVLMLHGLVGDGDFAGAAAVIRSELGEDIPYGINVDDLSRLHALSFTKELDRWDEKNSPVGRTFKQYHSIAKTFDSFF